jgi:hypothetical protein
LGLLDKDDNRQDSERKAQRARALHNLNLVTDFGADETSCRRVLQLKYFGEAHGAEFQCKSSTACIKGAECDNCQMERTGYEKAYILLLPPYSVRMPVSVNHTPTARHLVAIVRKVGSGHLTSNQLRDLYRGLPNLDKLERKYGTGLFGTGKSSSPDILDRIIHKLFLTEVLMEDIQETAYGAASYCTSGSREHDIDSPDFKLTLETWTKPRNTKKQTLDLHSPRDTPNSGDDPSNLWDQLTEVRKKMSTREKNKPYAICPNNTLKDMMKLLPTTVDAFLRVSGITQARAKKYGREFLEVITRFSLKDGREIQAALAAQAKDLEALVCMTQNARSHKRGIADIDAEDNDPKVPHPPHPLLKVHCPSSSTSSSSTSTLPAAPLWTTGPKITLFRPPERKPQSEASTHSAVEVLSQASFSDTRSCVSKASVSTRPLPNLDFDFDDDETEPTRYGLRPSVPDIPQPRPPNNPSDAVPIVSPRQKPNNIEEYTMGSYHKRRKF